VGDDGITRVWAISAADARELLRLPSHRDTTGVAFSDDGSRLVTTGGPRAMTIWDLGVNGDAEWANLAGAGDVVFAPTEHTVMASGFDGAITTLDLDTGAAEEGERTFTPTEGVWQHALSPDGGLVAVLYHGKWPYDPGPLTITDVASGREVSVPEPVAWVGWAAGGGSLIVIGGDGAVSILDRSGRVLDTIDPAPGFTVQAVALSPDGRRVAVTGYTGDPDVAANHWLTIRDRGQDEVVVTIPRVSADGLTFDDTGTRIASSGARHDIWDVESGDLISRLPALPGEGTYALAFSPDGSRLAVGRSDGNVRLFDVDSGAEVLALPHDAESLHFSPDGSMLASEGAGLVRIWALDIEDLLKIAQGEVTRSLTIEECRQYLHVDRCPG
jgi:WD40 repeat protein